MNQNEKVNELAFEVNSTKETKEVAEKEMSFKSMLEQFYKKNFEPIPEPDAPPTQQSFIPAH